MDFTAAHGTKEHQQTNQRGVSMKLEHRTIVTNDGRKIITSTWHTDSGKTTSQIIKSTDLKSGKVTTTYVGSGKLLP
jgi:hypothetical protein